MKIRKINVFLAFVLAFLLPVAFVSAADPIIDVELNNFDFTSNVSAFPLLVNTANQSRSSSLQNSSTRGHYLTPNDWFYTGPMTIDSNDPIDYLYFSVNANRYTMISFTSTNFDYKVLLCDLDSNGNLQYIWDIYDPGTTYLRNISAGDWVFVIYPYSTSTYSTTYTLAVNNLLLPRTDFTTNNITIPYNLKHIKIRYNDNTVYFNDQYVYTYGSSISQSHLAWTRTWRQSTGNVFYYRMFGIYDPKVSSISGVVAYSSQHASSQNAILIELAVDAGYTYEYIVSLNGGGYLVNDHIDPLFGIYAPRPLTSSDFVLAPQTPNNTGKHTLVYCLDTGKVIDFNSYLNFYYLNNIESWPTITR